MVVDLALLMLASQFEYTVVISVILGQRCLPDLLVMGFYCRCYLLLSMRTRLNLMDCGLNDTFRPRMEAHEFV